MIGSALPRGYQGIYFFESKIKMVWTGFSMLLFLWLGVLASSTFGGSIYLLVLLVAVVSLIKILQDRSPLSESFHSN